MMADGHLNKCKDCKRYFIRMAQIRQGHSMKQAKPTPLDLEKSMIITTVLSDLSSCNPDVPVVVGIHNGDGDREPFDINDQEQCARVLEYLIDLAAGSSLNRVVFSCEIMMNPKNEIVDPDKDTLEFHPKIKAWRESEKEKNSPGGEA